MQDLSWSPAEKAVARKAFQRALDNEVADLIREFKTRSGAIREVEQLWKLETFLTQRRMDIGRKYDYRYSVLPMVFATLVREGRLSEKDLQGIGGEKIERILTAAGMLID